MSSSADGRMLGSMGGGVLSGELSMSELLQGCPHVGGDAARCGNVGSRRVFVRSPDFSRPLWARCMASAGVAMYL